MDLEKEGLEKATTVLPGTKQFVMHVPEKFFFEIEDHVRSLQYLNGIKINKKDWVAKAIEEKLEKEDGFDVKNIPKERNINVVLEDTLHEKLEKKISFFKKFRSFSKKQFVVEAIAEKLERETCIVNSLSSKLKDSFQSQHSKN